MRKPGERVQLIGLAVAAAVAWGVAVYFSMVRPDEPTAATAEPAARASDGGAASSTVGGGAAATPSASVVAQPSASAVATAASAPARAVEADPTACVKALFASDAFLQGTTDFTFLCSDPYPRHGITQVQAQVVLGRGSARQMTKGMQEWAALGWYQLAAYALFRGRCCSKPAKLQWTFDLTCPLDQALAEIEQAVRSDDAAALEAAVDRYTQEARCITKLGQATNFGQAALPGQGVQSLRQFIERMGKADGH